MERLVIEVGNDYLWIPAYRYEEPSAVRCEAARRGGFKLSNGWVVDEFGVAPGTNRQRGGRIALLPKEAR